MKHEVFTARCDGVEDMRLLGRTKSFDGICDSWRKLTFPLLDYAGAVYMRLQKAMIDSEVLR